MRKSSFLHFIYQLNFNRLYKTNYIHGTPSVYAHNSTLNRGKKITKRKKVVISITICKKNIILANKYTSTKQVYVRSFHLSMERLVIFRGLHGIYPDDHFYNHRRRTRKSQSGKKPCMDCRIGFHSHRRIYFLPVFRPAISPHPHDIETEEAYSAKNVR